MPNSQAVPGSQTAPNLGAVPNSPAGPNSHPGSSSRAGPDSRAVNHQAEADRLLAEYRRSREQLAAVHRALAKIRASRASDDGMVTATVGPQGVLTGLRIEADAYRRYRPGELAALVVELTTLAAGEAAEQAQRVLEPVLPAGVDPAAVLAGTADLRPDELVAPDETVGPVPADDEPLDQRTWLEQAHPGRF